MTLNPIYEQPAVLADACPSLVDVAMGTASIDSSASRPEASADLAGPESAHHRVLRDLGVVALTLELLMDHESLPADFRRLVGTAQDRLTTAAERVRELHREF